MSITTQFEPSSQRLGLEALRSPADGALAPVERLRRLAALERGDIAVIFVYAIAIGLVSLAVPIAAQSLVNTVAFTALLQPIVVLSVLVLIGLFAAGVLKVLQYRVVETLQQRFFVRTTHDAILRLSRADARAFDDHGAPELMNRFFEVALVQKAASTLLMDGLSVMLQGAVSLVLLAFYHPALLAFDVLLLALILFVLFGLGRDGVSTAVKESKAKYSAAAWLEEMAGATRLLKMREASAFAFGRTDEFARAYVNARRKHFKVLLRQIVASYVLQAIATASLLGLGGYLVINGQLTLGQLVAAELIVAAVLSAVSKFGKYLESYYDLAASVDKLGLLVDLPSERVGGVPLPQQPGAAHVVVENVTTSYGGIDHALRDVSFDVNPGARVAILVGDAAGKNALVDLLYGFGKATRGQVKLDGIDARTVELSALRRDVVLVGHPEVFDASVTENLCLGRDSVDATRMAEALDAVELTEEIGALPDGAASRLGHAGSHLTRSQAARLTLARALVVQPRLLILDEALDCLASDVIERILHRVDRLAQTTTLIVFTAREEVSRAVGSASRLIDGTLVSSESP